MDTGGNWCEIICKTPVEGTFINISYKEVPVPWVNLDIPIDSTVLQNLEIYGDWDRFKNTDSFGYD